MMNTSGHPASLGPSIPRGTASDSTSEAASMGGFSNGDQAHSEKSTNERYGGDRQLYSTDNEGDIDGPGTKEEEESEDSNRFNASNGADEKTPLLGQSHNSDPVGYRSRNVWSLPKHIASGIMGTFRVIVSAVFAPGRYIVACFYDEQGRFSAAMPFLRMGRRFSRTHPGRQREPISMPASAIPSSEKLEHVLAERQLGRRLSAISDGSSLEEKTAALLADGEHDDDSVRVGSSNGDSPAQNTRSKSTPGPADEEGDETSQRRATRIKIVNQEELRRRRQNRDSNSPQQPPLTVATIKSPTNAIASALRMTKYPRAPAPPRPLVPRRQPSYSQVPISPSGPQKTLIIDLDETLIHSMAKGGRMSTGHMVEVKLSSPVGVGGSVIGPQVPILYYVHKRPHCDEFLKKVSKWYNLIIFTASVQEYADPVIDWLELERKYFSARYYRQHCTYRQGAYIKDLSQVEPDLSKVMILDNSPMSYIFHEDNAIPIEGWISDPTDNDLLHLIPLFEGLQHATDVRALLSLRLGESM